MKFKDNLNKYTVTQMSTAQEKDDFKDDYVTQCMGAFGYWQAIMCPIVCLVRLIVGWNIVAIVYLTPSTQFTCVRLKNDSAVGIDDVISSTCYADCIEYEYSSEMFEDTLISKFGLICENAWLKSFTQTMMMFGLLVGVASLGWLSDRYGRRKSYLLATTIAVVFMLACPFAPTYWIFTSLRFFVGVGIGGIISLCVVINIEMVGQKYRAFAGVLSILSDGIGQILLSTIAYYTLTWHQLILITGLISVLWLLMLFVVPETPRWLVAQRRGDEAIAMMTKVAKFNGLKTSHIKETVEKAIEDMHSHRKEVQKYYFVDLFRSAGLTRTVVASVVMWFAGGICFFGLNHYSTLLGLNIFVVVPLMGLVQFIGPFVALFINKFFGRKVAVLISFCVIGLAMVALVFIPDGHWGCSVTTGIGLMFSIVLFGIIYTQSNELYPTPLRNMGVAISSAGSKAGAMVAPFLANTQPHWVASTIFAVVPFVGALVSLVLPETKGKTLKDTID